MEWLAPLLKGLGTGYGLIIAIGAQNAFVLSQGVRQRHPLLVAAVCSVIDAALIGIGVAGMGALISGSPPLLRLAAWGGALFLLVYGGQALWRALRPQQGLRAAVDPAGGAYQAVLAALAVSLLNPHVYLDTVVLLGSIGGRYPDPSGKLWFAVGATVASVSWFFSLSLGARRLAPLLRRPVAWRLLDGLIAVIMWAIAATLIRSALSV